MGTPRRILSDRYALDHEIGRGAMGVVFLARDLKHGREVAVKLLASETADAIGAERFIAEIRTAARLNHPHILAVHDSGEHDGSLYYVMPCVDGESLRQRLERLHWLPVAEAIRIATEIAGALAYAHARGIVHRDVKPENVLLDRSGHALLADFGLARALSSAASTQRTTAGVAIGSPPYMSPEQAAGDGRTADARSDIYSLACVLFEMLAGQPPFAADTIQATLRQHLTTPPPSIRARRADVPPYLDRAIKAALAKSPDERTATADEFARSLPAPSQPTPQFRWPDWTRTRIGRAAVGAMFVGGATIGIARLGGSGVSFLPWGRPPLDSLRIAVLPLEAGPGVPAAFDGQALLVAGLARWRELDVVDETVQPADERMAGRQLSEAEALELARSLRARRYIRATSTPDVDGVQFRAALHDATDQRNPCLPPPRAMPVSPVPTSGLPRYATGVAMSRIDGRVPPNVR